jgi:tyrosinase
MSNIITRRRFLVVAGASTAAAGFGCSQNRASLQDNFNPRLIPALLKPVRVRPNVMSLDPNGPEMNAYRTAVSAMQGLPASDPLNWINQAEIHHNHCPHGFWFFLPWHRAYLYYFERICRKLSGNDEFMLPYWDWTTHPTLPPAFTQSGDVLNHPRDLDPSTPIPDEFVGSAVMNNIYNITDFQTFGSLPAGEGQLESVPHDHVHESVGGDMGSVPTAARDPIFWLHHCNIDRVWWNWAARFGHNDPTDSVWLDKTYSEFFDESGNPATIKVSDVLDTHPLGYVYSQLFIRIPIPLPIPQWVQQGDPALLGQGPVENIGETGQISVRLSIAAERVQQLNGAVALMPDERGTLRLTLSDVKIPDEGTSNIRVFMNAPQANAATPVTDSHFLATIGTFPGHGMAMARTISLDAWPVVERLIARGELKDGQFTVQLVPVSIDKTGRVTPIRMQAKAVLLHSIPQMVVESPQAR